VLLDSSQYGARGALRLIKVNMLAVCIALTLAQRASDVRKSLAMADGVFVFAFRNGMPDNEVRALTFVSPVLSIFSLKRSFSPLLKLALVRPNAALFAILLGVCSVVLERATHTRDIPVRSD
jgi:hypothetical protein